jgi:hypothetical protein
MIEQIRDPTKFADGGCGYLSFFLLVIILPVLLSFGHYIACPFFFWSLYCLSFFLLVIILPVLFSFGHYIAFPFFFWSLYCLSFYLLVIILPVLHFLVIVLPVLLSFGKKERQYNDQKKKGQAI